jgi:hypothetical protein
MSTIRFTLIAVGLFALTFVGISWANKGFPVIAMRAEPMKPDARVPTFEDSVKKGIRKDWENSKTSQSDGDKERDRLRIELLQASIGYKLSPCDGTMKKNLVSAATNYTNAWGEMAGCKFGMCGDDKKLDAAAAAFQTPADVRVHQEMREAFEQGGIGKDDFPKSVRNNVFMWTGMPFGEPAACFASRRAENTRR